MKKNMRLSKKIDQFLIEDNAPIELEELHVFLIKNISKRKAKKQHELYNNLKLRYYENGITLKKAQIKLDSLNPRFNQSLIRIF